MARLWACPIPWCTASPFPDRVWACAVLGAITRDRLEAVRESDAILREELLPPGSREGSGSNFTVVPDFKSVGVRDGVRTFDWPVILRAVNTVDAMTATVEDGCPLPYYKDHRHAHHLEVKGVNRVLYD